MPVLVACSEAGCREGAGHPCSEHLRRENRQQLTVKGPRLGSMLSTEQGCPAPSAIRFNGTAKVQLP